MNKRNNIIIDEAASVTGFPGAITCRANRLRVQWQMRANHLDRKRCAIQSVNLG